MKGSKVFATIMLSALLFTGCGLKDRSAIITINGKPITEARYNKMFDEVSAQSPFGSMKGFKDNKDGFFYLMTEQNVVNQLIIEELLNQEADKRGIKVTKDDINESMEKVYAQVGGKDRLVGILKENGVSVSQFKKDIQKQARMQKLATVAGNIKVTDKDCQDFYKKNQSKFKNPDQVRASHILVMANPLQIEEELKTKSKKEISKEELKTQVEKRMADLKAKAEKIDAELKADPKKFEQYARKYSEDVTSAKQGGDLGYFAKDKMVPEFSAVAFEQKPNTVSDVVKSQYGYHIILVTDRREAGVIPYDQAKDKIKDYLKTSKQVKALDELTTAAKKTAKIEYSDSSFNPEEIQKKLNVQMDAMTKGQASKVKAASKPAKK